MVGDSPPHVSSAEVPCKLRSCPRCNACFNTDPASQSIHYVHYVCGTRVGIEIHRCTLLYACAVIAPPAAVIHMEAT